MDGPLRRWPIDACPGLSAGTKTGARPKAHLDFSPLLRSQQIVRFIQIMMETLYLLREVHQDKNIIKMGEMKASRTKRLILKRFVYFGDDR